MKQGLLLAVLALNASPAFAGSVYECDNIKGIEEYTLTIDFNSNQASFFDNDATVDVGFESMRRLDSFPVQYLYRFKGEDTNSDEGSTLTVVFNKTLLKAYLILF